MRTEDVEGRESLQQALHTARKRGYYVSVRRSLESNEVSDFILAHPESRDLLNMFPYVVVMDSAYKTNAYKMPLLEIVGITNTKKTFAIALVFMVHETFDHYEWALMRLRHLCNNKIPEVIVTNLELSLINALSIVFPEVKHMLCTFNIKTNIRHRSRALTRSKEAQQVFTLHCNALFESRSSASYERRLVEMKEHWKSHPKLMVYLEETWLIPYKEAFVRAWCDLYHHFGTNTTNACKSMYKLWKDTLTSTVGGFQSVVDNIDLMITDQIHKIQCALEMSRDRIRLDVRIPIFDLLRNYVTNECFTLLMDNYNKAQKIKDDGICLDSYWREVYGVPCVHDFIIAIRASKPITLKQIHPFWKQVHWSQVAAFDDDDEEVHINSSVVSLNSFKERLNSSNDDEFEQMTSTHENMVDTGSTSMREPTHVKTKRKSGFEQMTSAHENMVGTGSTSMREPTHVKTKRKSEFEQMTSAHENMVDTGSTSMRELTHVKTKRKSVVRQSTMREPSEFPWGIGEINNFILSYVSGYLDVLEDGNCGYRAIALVLGYPEEDYLTIREEMVWELHKRKALYTQASILNSIDELIKNVYYKQPGPCPQQNWMEMPIVGLVAATYYRIALVCLGPYSHTCLPMTQLDSNQGPPTEIRTIAWVKGGTHYVAVWLKEDSPIPSPPPEWRHYHDPSVDGWDEPFAGRMKQYDDSCRLK